MWKRASLLLLTGACLWALEVKQMSALTAARDKQDLAALDSSIAQLRGASEPLGEYSAALAYSYAAEVAMELKDKKRSANYAEAGLDLARKAVAANGNNAEYHRLAGELCGQVIPATGFLGALKYGQCAHDEIARAIELDPHSALAYVSRGVGNFYLPASMGGGPALALQDFERAISLDPKLGEAYLWKGLALRKENHNGEARAALQQALAVDPGRLWAKQELEKTPVH